MPLDRSNLVWRAANVLWRALRRAGEARDVVIRLEKRIPLQSGLGGGSADAAATLVALAQLWQVDVRPSQLTDLAGDDRLRRSVLPLGRHGAGAWPRRRGLPARRPPAPLDRPADSRVWRVDGGSLWWYDSDRGRGELTSGSAIRRRAVAVALRADDQRPRGADLESSSGDRSHARRASPGGRRGCGDVGQRVYRVRSVPAPAGGRGRRDRAGRLRLAGVADAIAGAGRVRAPDAPIEVGDHFNASGRAAGGRAVTPVTLPGSKVLD